VDHVVYGGKYSGQRTCYLAVQCLLFLRAQNLSVLMLHLDFLSQTAYSGVKKLPVDSHVAFQYCGTVRVSFTDAADAVFLFFVA
jgi:hypothetical protein